MRTPTFIGAAWLLALLFFGWGYLTVRHHVFPWSVIAPVDREISAWLGDVDEGEQLGVADLVAADIFGADVRYRGQSPVGDTLSLSPASDPHGLLDASSSRIEFFADGAEGAYIVYAKIGLPESEFGAIVLSSEGVLKKVIPSGRSDRQGQGGVTEFGQFIFNTIGDLDVMSSCGDQLISLEGTFHHKASGDGDTIWAWDGNDAKRISLSTGEVVQQFDLVGLVGANEDLPLLEGRLSKKNRPGKVGQWKYEDLAKQELTLPEIALIDPFHHNDIDVLTPERAPLFPQFDVGDLLLSFRSLNTVVVVDPDTLQIKWWTAGLVSGQHDPDWSENGEITIYNNRMHSSSSRVDSINVETKELTVLVDGADRNIFQFAGGHHDYQANGSVFLTNGAEAISMRPDGEVEFYVRVVNSDGDPLKVSTLRHIDEATFQEWFGNCP